MKGHGNVDSMSSNEHVQSQSVHHPQHRGAAGLQEAPNQQTRDEEKADVE